MKNIVVLLLILIFKTSFAVEKMPVKSETESHNVFGATVLKYTEISNQGAFFLGAHGGWIINRSILLGAGVYGLISDISTEIVDQENIRKSTDNMDLIYGGLEIGYMVSPAKSFHISLNSLVGMGKVSLGDLGASVQDSKVNNFHSGEVFFVLEPEVNFMANITSFLRFDIGISYRIVSKIGYQSITAQDITGLNGIIALRFGNF